MDDLVKLFPVTPLYFNIDEKRLFPSGAVFFVENERRRSETARPPAIVPI